MRLKIIVTSKNKVLTRRKAYTETDLVFCRLVCLMLICEYIETNKKIFKKEFEYYTNSTIFDRCTYTMFVFISNEYFYLVIK